LSPKFREGHGFSRAADEAVVGALAPVVCFGRNSKRQALKRRDGFKLAARVNSCPSRFVENARGAHGLREGTALAVPKTMQTTFRQRQTLPSNLAARARGLAL
jgi:hypothetical protein